MFKKLKKMPKVLVAALATAFIVAVPIAVKAGFGPDRQTFDWNVNPGTCDLQTAHGDRCGAVTPTFNSFVNTPSYGDERNFTRIADVVPGQSPNDATFSETATAVPGKEYWVRTLVHNDANQNLNCAPEHRDANTNDCTQIDPGSPGIATGTTVKVEIASGVANGVDIMTKVGASNATPATVWDTATLANDNQNFSVSYVNGSAVIYNGAQPGLVPLDDSIVSDGGVPIGYGQMDGNVPGCFDFSAYVYVRVVAKAPTLQINKLVRNVGQTQWQDSISAKKGDDVQWRIEYKNAGNDVANDVTIRDTMPQGTTLVPGTIKWNDAANHGTVQHDDALDQGGVNLGNYAPAGDFARSGAIEFETKLNSDIKDCELTNVAYLRAQDVPEVSDTAHVTIENCQPTTPTFSCDLLDITKGDHMVTISKFETSVSGGATFKDVTVNWNDNTPNLLTNNVIGQTHTYSGNGPFNITAVARFSVNGQDQTAGGAQCAKAVSFTTEKCTVPGKENLPKDSPECKVVTTTSTTPTILPKTGAGSVVGIFAAVSVMGAFAHRYLLGRRYQ